MGEKGIRAFLAFDLTEEVTESLAAVQQQLAARNLKIKWVAPENIHLTIKFLGEISPAAVDSVTQAAAAAAGRTVPTTSIVRGLGVFPNLKRPSVIWAGLAGDTGPLFELQADLEERLAEAGFPKDKRAFRAHLTIGRIKSPINARRLAEAMADCGEMIEKGLPLERLTLYKSDLKPTGAIYTALAAFPLSGG